MAIVGLISGERFSVPEVDAETLQRRITQSETEFVELRTEQGKASVRALHVAYVLDDHEMPQVEETIAERFSASYPPEGRSHG